MRHIIATLATALLSACGGQVSAKPLNICLQPSDRIAQTAGCDSTIQPVIAYDEDVVSFVNRQMQQPGNVMLWIGKNDWTHLPGWRNRNYAKVIAAAKPYIASGKVTHVYIADEPNWCGDHVCLGRDDALMAEATEIAHAAGIKTAAAVVQQVVFAPGFQLPRVDVIGVGAYYVTMDQSLDMGGCKLSSNVIANQTLCTGQKLRSLGFTGEFVFLGEAFGLTTDTHAYRMMYLQLQVEAYEQIKPYVSATMAYYCHYDPYVAATEPNLVPLCGTQYEPLVTP